MADCGTVEVEPPEPDFDPSNVRVVDCGVSDSSATVGDTITATPQIRNDNEQGADATVELLLNGDRETTQNVSIPGGSTENARFDISIESDGQLDIETNVTDAQEA